jgi:hypothetical protein
MGQACCNKRPSSSASSKNIAPSNEREISVQKYTSSNDSFFDDIENKYNILTYIQLVEYINLLEFYNLENATLDFEGEMKTEFSSKDTFLSYVMSVDEFQSFIENKLLKLTEIYELSGKNEQMVAIFKTVFREIYSSLELKLNQHYGVKTNDRITKKTLIPLGILFCISNVVGKIKLIFDIFKNDEGVFIKSSEFDDYLLSSFLICSYCMISARRKISATAPNIPEMSKEDLIKCLGVCELKDCQHLINVFNDSFFDKDSFTWIEFKEKFENKEKGFQWILSSRGIRKKLEENNV